jgi:phosphatidate cytidylyltransferase
MLKERVGTALVLFVLFLAGLFYLSNFQWALLMLAVVCMGAWEWATLIRLSSLGIRLFSVTVAALGAGLLWCMTTPSLLSVDEAQPWLIIGITIFWAAAVPLWLILRPRIDNRLFLAGVGLLVLLPTWMALDGLRRISPLLLLAVMFTVWIADTAAYFAGKRFGRRKLAPAISPGKTWEGVLGALCGVALYGLVLCATLDVSFWLIPGLLVLVVLSVVGDLFESLLKRQAGLKDSGNLLPGHGGVLDRIDGLTSTLPLVLFYFPVYRAILGLA